MKEAQMDVDAHRYSAFPTDQKVGKGKRLRKVGAKPTVCTVYVRV